MGKALHAIALQGMERSFLICRSFQMLLNSTKCKGAGNRWSPCAVGFLHFVERRGTGRNCGKWGKEWGNYRGCFATYRWAVLAKLSAQFLPPMLRAICRQVSSFSNLSTNRVLIKSSSMVSM